MAPNVKGGVLQGAQMTGMPSRPLNGGPSPWSSMEALRLGCAQLAHNTSALPRHRPFGRGRMLQQSYLELGWHRRRRAYLACSVRRYSC